MFRLILGVFLAAFALGVHADLGDPDPTFGTEGLAPVQGCCTVVPVGIARQPDGKIVVAAAVYSAGPFGFGQAMAISRLLPNGAPDPAFNGGNPVPLFGGTPATVSQLDRAFLLQPDGKILAAGRWDTSCQSFSCPSAVGIARLLADGSLDPSFGTGGRTQVPWSLERTVGMAVQADGRIVVGTRRVGGGLSYGVLRFTPAGVPDTSFGNGGGINFAIPGDDGSPFHGAVFTGLPDGRMVLAHFQPFTVARLTAEGAADSTFNGNGSAIYTPGVRGMAMVANDDGGLFLASSNGPSSNGVVMRVQPNGALDASWGDAGQRQFGDGFLPAALAVQDDGTLVASGVAVGKTAFRRWLPDGKTDGSLRSAGYAISNVDDGFTGPGTPSPLIMAPEGQALARLGSQVGRFGGTLDVLGVDRIFVEQQFRDFLSRPGDPGGVDYWTGQISSGATTRPGLVRQFLESPEFLARFAPIVRLYLAYFLRAPDYVGLLYWTSVLRTSSLDNVSYAFNQSAEFTQRYGSLDNGQFVQLVYQNVLGRQPDAAGLAHWRARLDSGEVKRWHMMTAFSESSEYVGLSFNEVLVTMTYVGLLRRGPDDSGFPYWLSQLDSGHPPEAFLDGFIKSAEYHNRFYP